MSDERIWCVRRYPDGELLHTELSYDECDRWRTANNLATYITPAFFELATVPDRRRNHERREA